MNNTIPNVPRDWFDRVHALLYKIAHESTPEGLEAECLGSFIPDILSAPSPAGVDELEVVALWYADDDLGRAVDYVKIADGEGLCRLSDAQAIIDGLRGEVERSKSFAAGHVLTNERISAKLHTAETERDQQAQRIGELEGLLLACHSALYPFDNKVLEAAIDAALSAGKEGE